MPASLPARGLRAADFALLQSWKRDENDGYVVASRSVLVDDLPPTRGHKRGDVLPSGFLLEAADADTSERVSLRHEGACTRLVYVAQMELTGLLTGALRSTIIDALCEVNVRRMVRLQCELAPPRTAGGSGGRSNGGGGGGGGGSPCAAEAQIVQQELTTVFSEKV
jgi:hypothetical protein